MSLKNYTTDVPANKSIAEIQQMLQKHGVSGIMMEYEPGTGQIESLAFKLDIEGRTWAFRLPLRWRNAHQVMYRGVKDQVNWRTGESRYKKSREEQAYRVAWRILKDWVAVQMALVELEIVQVQEVFLPYIIQKNGQTLFENITKNPGLLLGDGGNN